MNDIVEKILEPESLKVWLKYVSNMFGAAFGTLLAIHMDRRKATDAKTGSESEVKQLEAATQGLVNNAKMVLNSGLEISDTIDLEGKTNSLAISFQVQKRAENLRNIAIGSAHELKGKAVKDHEPNLDFVARVSHDAQDVSSEELQSWWSRILAGEIQNSGQTSLRTLDVLKNMSQKEAVVFKEFSNYVIAESFLLSHDGLSSSGDDSNTILYHGNILLMQECGLISTSLSSQLTLDQETKVDVFPYHSDHLIIERSARANSNLQIPIILLTKAGQELYKIMNPNTQMSYLQKFAEFLHNKHYQLYLKKGFELHPGGTMTHTSKIRIKHA